MNYKARFYLMNIEASPISLGIQINFVLKESVFLGQSAFGKPCELRPLSGLK